MARRILGTLLILLGALGIALSALGIIYVWRAVEDITAAADDGLTLVSDTLTDVDRSLNVASSTLDSASIAMNGLYTTTLDVSDTLSTTQLTVNEMARLAEHELPQSIESSLVALEALEETALLIDRLLRSLQQLGVGDYNPQVPLDEAVSDAGAGLAPVPDSLRAMGAGLHETSASLEDVQSGIALMGEHMVGIQENVGDADAVLSSLRETLGQFETRVGDASRNLDRPIEAAAWAATLLLSWIGLSQLAIVHWGIDLWQRRDTKAG